MSFVDFLSLFKTDKVKLEKLQSLVVKYLSDLELIDAIQTLKVRLIQQATTYELTTLLESVKILKYKPYIKIISFNGRIIKLLDDFCYIDNEILCHRDSWTDLDTTECQMIKNRFCLHDTDLIEIKKFFIAVVSC